MITQNKAANSNQEKDFILLYIQHLFFKFNLFRAWTKGSENNKVLLMKEKPLTSLTCFLLFIHSIKTRKKFHMCSFFSLTIYAEYVYGRNYYENNAVRNLSSAEKKQKMIVNKINKSS